MYASERKKPMDPKWNSYRVAFFVGLPQGTVAASEVYLWKWESDKEFHLHLVLFIKGTCLLRNSFTLSNSRRTTFMWFSLFPFLFHFWICALRKIRFQSFFFACFVCAILVQIYDFHVSFLSHNERFVIRLIMYFRQKFRVWFISLSAPSIAWSLRLT